MERRRRREEGDAEELRGRGKKEEGSRKRRRGEREKRGRGGSILGSWDVLPAAHVQPSPLEDFSDQIPSCYEALEGQRAMSWTGDAVPAVKLGLHVGAARVVLHGIYRTAIEEGTWDREQRA